MMNKRLFVLLIALLMLSACGFPGFAEEADHTATAAKAPALIDIQILATSDLHGKFVPYDDKRDMETFSLLRPGAVPAPLFEQGYIDAKSGHSRGSTIDLTLFDIANQSILCEAMLRHGFNPLDTEWWHFTWKDEPYPDTYFTFKVNTDSVK